MLSLLFVVIMLDSSLTIVIAYQYSWKTESYKINIGLKIIPPIKGDINKDGKVDEHDLRILAAAYGSTPNSPHWNPSADINNDTIVDAHDLYVLATNFEKP